MTERKFYKTTYTVVILHEEPMPEDMDLKAALEEAETGMYSGDVISEETVEVDGQMMARLLIEQRSSPAIFLLTRDGEDVDDG
jgi:hypothetical protein